MILECKQCLKAFENQATRRQYCPECKLERRKEASRAHYLRNKEKIKERARSNDYRAAERKRHEKYKTRKKARMYGVSSEKIKSLEKRGECHHNNNPHSFAR